MTGGYQSDLLLSDKLILVAVVTLNDGAGNVLRRRLLSFASKSQNKHELSMIHSSYHASSADGGISSNVRRLLQQQQQQDLNPYIHVPLQPVQADADPSTVQVGALSSFFASHAQSHNSLQRLQEALRKIASEPRTGALPSFEYNVDVPRTVSQIYGVGQEKPFAVFDFVVYGRFDQLISRDDALSLIGNEFYRRLQANVDKFCTSCERIVPVFSNLQRCVSTGLFPECVQPFTVSISLIVSPFSDIPKQPLQMLDRHQLEAAASPEGSCSNRRRRRRRSAAWLSARTRCF